MKKGVAVPYIIAIVLGVAVLALLGYWFYITSGTFSKEQCRQAYRDWCQGESNAGYTKTDDAMLTAWKAAKSQCVVYTEFTATEANCRLALGQPTG